MHATFWALVPPIVAIALALITKEVYSSLFVGIIVGGLFYSGFGFEGTLTHIFNDGLIAQLSDSYNAGILIFLVFLGIMVSLMNKAGGSAAFGKWASSHVKTRVGAELATILLGCLIFIDDYFNCLTVGSVMRPVTDNKKVSRAKLAYLIDATAAPVCIIAPISSWAAAVSGFAPEGTNGLMLFIKAIPYNYYAILTIVMMVMLSVMNLDFGPMAKHEENAKNGDIFTVAGRNTGSDSSVAGKGKVIDLILPVIALIICCVIGMIYTGGFFEGESFIDSFANSDASVGLVLGSFVGLFITLVFYLIRKVLSLRECMECIPEGFKAMVPAIIILALAWTLKAMTDSLGAAEYVAGIVSNSASSLLNLLPAIIFVIAAFLAFATGTSWGTFGILIPITLNVFPLESGNPISIICVSACMAGAVCGDHCSPISDTTIMSSAGAQCDHIAHVSTQLPYALTVAAISFVTYIMAGFVRNAVVSMIIGIIITVFSMICIRYVLGNDKKEKA
ncbi:MAG: Na+/H+ antiporter NhaC family protein [Lachnospiraceae bacterium]|nr:Na+/H+ antiporter NhaC family protein [Lachnospiraceae bacterium]